MNLRKMILFLACLLVGIAALFACTLAKKQESTVEQKKKSVNSGQVPTANKNLNEAIHRLQNAQRKQRIQNLSQYFPTVAIYKGPSNRKLVALTFDDGPDNYYTPRILDILQAKGVHATFFMVGKQAKHFPLIVKKIAEEGNAIGNHSWDHPELWKLSNAQVTQEIVSTQNEIQQITGQRTTLFRPPYGKLTPADMILIHNLGYRIIDWSVDTLDWKGSSAHAILQNVNKEVSPGGIILEHSLGRPGELNGTLQALPQIIDRLKAQGYEFVTIPTLIGQ